MTTVYIPMGKMPWTGGNYVNFEHIRFLTSLGVEAKVLLFYPQEEPSYQWFLDNNILVADYFPQEKALFQPDDLIIIGEAEKVLFQVWSDLPCRIVMHNQNPFYTFSGFDSIEQLNRFPCEYILTPSAVTRKILVELGVIHPIEIVYPYIPDMFVPDWERKKLQIAYIPRKMPDEAALVMAFFHTMYPQYRSIPWVRLENTSRENIAKTLSESAICAAFALKESLGLANLEAMACGCLMVGYSGHCVGELFFNPNNGRWVDYYNHIQYAKQLAAAVQDFLMKNNQMARQAAQDVDSHWRYRHFEHHAKKFYAKILGLNVDNQNPAQSPEFSPAESFPL